MRAGFNEVKPILKSMAQKEKIKFTVKGMINIFKTWLDIKFIIKFVRTTIKVVKGVIAISVGDPTQLIIALPDAVDYLLALIAKWMYVLFMLMSL